MHFQQGVLPVDILAQVPYSTRHNWRSRDLSTVLGFGDPRLDPANLEFIRELIQQNHLRPILVTLLRVNRILRKVLGGIQNHRKLLERQKSQIVLIIERSTVQMGSRSGVKKARRHILQWLGVSVRQFHHWQSTLKPCPSSLLNLCRKKHPLQLAGSEVKTIQTYLQDPAFLSWTLASIYHRILSDGAAFFSISTFYIYANRIGFSRRFRTFRIRKEGIRGSKPGEIIHADITEFRLSDHRRVHIYHVIDNFSRFVFTCRAEFVKSPDISLENLEAILVRFPDLFRERISLLVDDGGENKGSLREYADRNREIVLLLIAQKDIQFSNSMVESANRTLKNQYLRDREFASLESLQVFLDEYRKDFNSRNLHALKGLTPMEVLSGQVPCSMRFVTEMAQAKRLRIEKNQAHNCEGCSK
jgi:putative transposase